MKIFKCKKCGKFVSNPDPSYIGTGLYTGVKKSHCCNARIQHETEEYKVLHLDSRFSNPCGEVHIIRK